MWEIRGLRGKKDPRSACNSCWDADETHFAMLAAYICGNDVAKQKKTKCKGFSMLHKYRKCLSHGLKQKFPTQNICYQAAKKEADRGKVK